MGTPTGNTGGMVGDIYGQDPYSYDPADFGGSSYMFEAPDYAGAYGASADLATKGLTQQSEAGLQKAQDQAAYSGEGATGALGAYQEQEAQRNLQSQLGDTLKGLGETQALQQLEGEKWMQTSQAGEDFQRAMQDELSRQFGQEISSGAMTDMMNWLGQFIMGGQQQPGESESWGF
jgi:hypothetical protein